MSDPSDSSSNEESGFEDSLNTIEDENSGSTLKSSELPFLRSIQARKEDLSNKSRSSHEDLRSWINFNLICIEKDLNINLDMEKNYNHKDTNLNMFFDTEVFLQSGLQSGEEVEVEEGSEKCPRCSGFKVFSYQSQIRSADEGMTNFLE